MSLTDRSVPAEPARTLDDFGVAVLYWPDERSRDDELGRAGVPRLLLVAPDAPPPLDWDRLVDWIRLPAENYDVWARVAMLQRRTTRRPPPRLDEYDVLWRGRDWVGLSRIEALIMRLLMERPGTVSSRRTIGAAGWPDGVPPDRAVDRHVNRLRRRIEPLDLVIHTVRQRGHFLEVVDCDAGPVD
jgi:two-component system, OmpR family, response regulator